MLADMPLTAESAAIRCWQTHVWTLGGIENRIQMAIMADTALFVYPCAEWRATNLIQHMRGASMRSASLPPELRLQATSQRSVFLHLAGDVGAACALCCDDVCTVLGNAPEAGEHEVCLTKLRILEGLPAFVSIIRNVAGYRKRLAREPTDRWDSGPVRLRMCGSRRR